LKRIDINIDFLDRFLTKTEQKTQNIENPLDFKTSLGRKNFFLGRGSATPASNLQINDYLSI
jgi:hypothetical protein